MFGSFAFAILIAGSSFAIAQTARWNNTGSNWGTANNWSPSGIPAATNAVELSPLSNTGVAPLNANLAEAQSILSLNLAPNFRYGNWTISATGSPTLTIGGSGSTGLTTRGPATYTLSGPVLQGASSSNKLALDLGNHSSLVLSGSTQATSNIGAITFRGGTLAWDNSAGNVTGNLNRVDSAGSLNFNGGGTLEMRANTTGINPSSVNSSMVLALNAGSATVRIAQPTGTTAGSSILLKSLSRGSSSAVVNFTSTGPGTLGAGGALDPKIKFATGTTPFLTNGVIATANGNAALGWAIYNGSDFAGYDATKGVVPVATNVSSGSGVISSSSSTNFMLTGNGTPASTTLSLNTLKISPTAAGQSLSLGASNTLNTVGILLPGSTDFAISGGTLTGGATRYLYVTNPNTTLSISSTFGSAGNPVNIAGGGFVALSGTTDQVANLGSLTRFNILEGTLRAQIASSGLNFSLNNNVIALRGGVFEVQSTGGTSSFERPLGITAQQVNWSQATGPSSDTGSGGFSAFGDKLAVNIGGDSVAPTTLVWGGQAGGNEFFVQDGYALKFGSTKSNHTVEWKNPIDLDSLTAGNYRIREINVIKGTGVATDKTQLTGVLRGSNSTGLIKTGDGVLELTAANLYSGDTAIQQGALLANNNSGSATGSGNVLVMDSGTLAGSGIISGAIEVLTGGTLSPGNSPGNLTGNGGLTMNSGATYLWELTSNTTSGAGTNFDRFTLANGSLSVDAAAILLPSFSGSTTGPTAISFWQSTHRWNNIFNITGGGSITGTSFIINNTPWSTLGAFSTTSAIAGSGIDLLWTPVPEPNGIVLAGLAGVGLHLITRRYRVRVAPSA